MLDIILRTIISFMVLLLLTRILGKKQLSQLTFFNYITGITLGSIAANFSAQSNISLINGIVSLICWTFLTIFIDYISLKFPKARVVLDGEPTIVIKKGKILNERLAEMRINMDDLSMMLRNDGIFSISEVEYAILEPDGKLSVLKKVDYQEVTKKDMTIKVTKPMYIPSEIIVDGKLINKNLKELNINHEWLYQQLKEAGINRIDEVFYAEIKSDGTIYIDKK
ncbi:YetF domain-containing protein [Tepidibacter aestuarii]|uniref:YetF domain-containing protein n=1 Tax=Tepidibacter aestuarii TaxID=2925782 RepID=UPI0020BF661C|nr:DUF421 domain-containing protein [Tepidibacter aestuarii]CAH2214583.1 DUF421 domain-containing protein [Tepidibacter aestuarii]